MHSFHFCVILLYTCTIADIHSNAASVLFPIHLYSLKVRRMNLSLLWENCIAAYLKEVFYAHSGSAHTIRDYSGILQRFFKHTAKSPERCTREDVINFIAMSTPAGTPPSHNTRNYRLNVVRGFYRFAARFVVYDGYGQPYRLFQGENPAEGLHRMKVEVRPRYLTEEEVLRFFAAIPRDTLRGLRDRALFLTYFLTARRLSEIANLLWGDIEYGTISDEQGNRPGYLYHWAGKGKGGQMDAAELPEPAYEAIVLYLKASGRMTTLAADDPIFIAVPNPKGGGSPIDPYKRLCDGSILRLAKEYAELAGIEKHKRNVHIWRHTSAKHRLDGGESIFSLKETLRHSSLDLTYRYARAMQTTGDAGAALLMGKFAEL